MSSSLEAKLSLNIVVRGEERSSILIATIYM